jgi:hypothetical protein
MHALHGRTLTTIAWRQTQPLWHPRLAIRIMAGGVLDRQPRNSLAFEAAVS